MNELYSLRFHHAAELSCTPVHFILSPYLNCIDRNGNLKLITLLLTVPVQIQANGIQEVLRPSSAAPSSIDLFLVLCKSLSSLSNPLWCSSVCWSRARVAWDYSDWGHTHTQKCTAYIYTLKCLLFTMWATTGMCQGVPILTVKGLSRLQGTLCVPLGRGKPSSPPPKGSYQGEII